MKQKIQALLNQLNHGLVEREDTLKAALLTVLTGENLVLIGPPGTGKSLIARRIADSLEHSSDGNNDGYFEYLLTKFSTPEEIFGPLSITALKADCFKRNTAGYLPTVKIAFLDEIFKASSSILNALLTILNERCYHNGSERQNVPLQALIAASNELPTDQDELSALYDRFLVRRFVDYVNEDNLTRLFDNAGTMPPLTQLTAADLNHIQRNADAVTLPDDIRQAMQRIWVQHKVTFKEDRRESLSDRRLKKVIKLLCVSAATNGRSEVDLSDVFLLKDCLWNHQDNAIKVREFIMNTLRSFSRPVPENGGKQFSGVHNELLPYELAHDGKTLIQAHPRSAARVNVSSALVPSIAKRSVVVKGFQGSGTAQDPLLIQTVDDLMDLCRPNVGLKGYSFRQTADIDCTALSSWTDIPFQGHYDGGGNTIKYKAKENGDLCDLFNRIQAQSSITHLNLESLVLASTAEHTDIHRCGGTLIRNEASNCLITDCESGAELIRRMATNCTISACKSGSHLIGGGATGCTITACESGATLNNGGFSTCTITDCLAVLKENLSIFSNTWIAGIANHLGGSLVERCFVTGQIHSDSYADIFFSGIATTLNGENGADSTIRQCAVGRLSFIGPYLDRRKWSGRIVEPSMVNGYTLENNASIDTNPGTDKINGIDGKTVAAAIFKQRYLEHTLCWDFETVWQWDDKEDRPALRSVGIGAASQPAKPSMQTAHMTDLLAEQMRANVWL